MLDDKDPDTWRMLDNSNVVHWLRQPYITTGTLACCDRTCAFLYDLDSPIAWKDQFSFVESPVTCVGCLASGPYEFPPPDVDTYVVDEEH